MVRILALVPALALLVACPPLEDDEVDCTMEARSSVSLTVVDGAGVEISGATATFSVDGGEPEACEAFPSGGLVCGWEREGSFAIVVSAPGFEDATVEVDVGKDECHVIGVAETVTLEPSDVACTEEARASVMLTTEEAGVAVAADRVQWRVRGGDGTLTDCDGAEGHYACGYEVAGELEILAELDGQQVATRVTVEEDECHVLTEEASIDFAPEACTDVFVFGVTVTTYDVDVPTDADSVEWGLANADMAPQPCESFGNGDYGCAGEHAGLIEITASYGDESHFALVEVLQGECHVLGETVGFVFGVPQ